MDEEEDVFFGPISDKELVKIQKLRRKTKVLPLICITNFEDTSCSNPSEDLDTPQEDSKYDEQTLNEDNSSCSFEVFDLDKPGEEEREVETNINFSSKEIINNSLSENQEYNQIDMPDIPPVSDLEMLSSFDETDCNLTNIQSFSMSGSLSKIDTVAANKKEENAGNSKLNTDHLPYQLKYEYTKETENYIQNQDTSVTLTTDNRSLNIENDQVIEVIVSEKPTLNEGNFEETLQQLHCSHEKIRKSLEAQDIDEDTPHLNSENDCKDLRVINVYDTKIYESFCIEDEGDKVDKKSVAQKIEKVDEKNLEEVESVIKVDNPLSNQHTDISISSSEGYSSHGSANCGMILSNSESASSHSLQYGEKTTKTNLNNSLTIESYAESSSSDESRTEERLCTPLSPMEQPSNVSLSSSSSNRRFNDTIEEMEMLLQNGMEYFERRHSPVKSPDVTETELSVKLDEVIISQGKERRTISSSNSIQSFRPDLDSTHASLFTQKKKKSEIEMQAPCISMQADNESMPLQKPDSECIPHQNPDQLPVTEIQQNLVLENKSSCSSNPKQKVVSDVMLLIQPPNVSVISMQEEYNNESIPLQKSDTECIPLQKLDSGCIPLHSSNFKTPSKINMLNTPTPKSSRTGSTTPSVKHLSSRPSNNLPKSSPATPGVIKKPNFNWKSSPSPRAFKLATTPSHSSHHPFLVPQAANKVSEKGQRPQTRTPQSFKKSRQMNIVSPVARYIQDNPPPPLIATVKPRHRISPCKLLKEVMSPSPTKLHSNNDLNESSAEREAVINKNEEDLKKLVLRVTAKSPLKEANSPQKTHEDNCFETDFVLPQSVYHEGAAVELENKENCTRRREIPGDRPPTLFVKHKGRTQISKKTDEPPESANTNDEVRKVSLMEVSVHETHLIHHTNTLK